MSTAAQHEVLASSSSFFINNRINNRDLGNDSGEQTLLLPQDEQKSEDEKQRRTTEEIRNDIIKIKSKIEMRELMQIFFSPGVIFLGFPAVSLLPPVINEGIAAKWGDISSNPSISDTTIAMPTYLVYGALMALLIHLIFKNYVFKPLSEEIEKLQTELSGVQNAQRQEALDEKLKAREQEMRNKVEKEIQEKITEKLTPLQEENRKLKERLEKLESLVVELFPMKREEKGAADNSTASSFARTPAPLTPTVNG